MNGAGWEGGPDLDSVAAVIEEWLQEAEEEAGAILARADGTAAAVLDEAGARADKIVAEARRRAERVMAEAEAHMADARRDAEELVAAARREARDITPAPTLRVVGPEEEPPRSMTWLGRLRWRRAGARVA